MKNWIKICSGIVFALAFLAIVVILVLSLNSCSEIPSSALNGFESDVINTRISSGTLQSNQPTPTDIEYSLERYNLIRRAYWVNGKREKAISLLCEIEKPLGYVVLFSGNAVVGRFVVDGKVTNLNSYLTPDSEYYEQGRGEYAFENDWLADVDGSFGENDNGIFFFTPDGKYIEWSGDYLYSDIPFEIHDPIVTVEEK